MEEFPWALLAGISYWRRRKINSAADRDDVVKVTKLINGGINGLADRKQYLQKAKAIWMDGVSGTSNPVLALGDKGPDVTELQNELIQSGFKVFADGEFGKNTEEAVKAFQRRLGLTRDGKVGAKTWAALLASSS